MIYVGIDPGLFGAMAVLTTEGHMLWIRDTPVVRIGSKHHYNYAEMRRLITSLPSEAVVAVEEVHTFPKQGVVSQGRMMYGLGLWHGLILAHPYSLERPSPQTWKKMMLRDVGEKGKDASRWKACQLFPDAAPLLQRKKDDGRAEALLIAEWCRRTRLGHGAP